MSGPLIACDHWCFLFFFTNHYHTHIEDNKITFPPTFVSDMRENHPKYRGSLRHVSPMHFVTNLISLITVTL